MTPQAKAQAATLIGDPSPRGVIYRAVREAAAKGRPAPTNAALAALIGRKSIATPSVALGQLARDGAITLEIGSCQRQIGITATGASTSVSPNFRTIPKGDRDRRAVTMRSAAARRTSIPLEVPPENLSDTEGNAVIAATKASAQRFHESRQLTATSLKPIPIGRATPILRHAPPPGADPRPFAHGREPCPRCAIRGDIGCAHQQPFQETDQ